MQCLITDLLELELQMVVIHHIGAGNLNPLEEQLTLLTAKPSPAQFLFYYYFSFSETLVKEKRKYFLPSLHPSAVYLQGGVVKCVRCQQCGRYWRVQSPVRETGGE